MPSACAAGGAAGGLSRCRSAALQAALLLCDCTLIRKVRPCADVGRVVAPMWAESRCRCGPCRGADVGRVAVQMWAEYKGMDRYSPFPCSRGADVGRVAAPELRRRRVPRVRAGRCGCRRPEPRPRPNAKKQTTKQTNKQTCAAGACRGRAKGRRVGRGWRMCLCGGGGAAPPFLPGLGMFSRALAGVGRGSPAWAEPS